MRPVLFLVLLCASLPAAELTFAVQLRWAGAPLAVPSAEMNNAAGQPLRLTRFSALVSGLSLLRADGGVVRLDGQYGFLDAESGRLAVTLRGVPAGDYAGLEFSLGVPAEANHADPGRWPAGHALNPLTAGLHWSWSGGYIFLALEGRWRDTAAAGEERGFSFHVATDARRMTQRFLAAWRIEGDTTVTLALDLAKILAPQRLALDDGSTSTHSGEGDTLAPRLAAAAERAWFWLEAAPTRVAAMATTERRVEDHAPYLAATPLAFTVPAGFPQPELPADNPLTVEGVALGKALFTDARLAKDHRQTCATCHREQLAFSDGQVFSTGADRIQGTRSSMPLFNLAWNPAFAWDGGRARIRDQSHAAMTGAGEMHADPAAVAAELNRDEKLRAKFAAAFGTPEISAARIGLALEQYLLTIVSADSRFDRAARGAVQLTAEEKRGFELFATESDPARGKRGADCFHCHGGALFSDYGYKNNGLDRAFDDDSGREKITGRTADRGKFKTPSLRNVARTAPYMHDGRFGTLEDVVAHYDHGTRASATLDPNIAKHPATGLGLPPEDQRALVAFLKTLTDSRFEK